MKVIFTKNYLKDLYERGYTSDICQITINNKTMIEIPGIDPQMIANNLKPDFAFHPGEIIMDELEYLNITQKEFAQRMNMPSCNLSSTASGNRGLTAANYLKAADILETTVDALLQTYTTLPELDAAYES